MEKQAGVIVVLTKNGDPGAKVPLKTNTPCSFGSSANATVRMHKENQDLREFHCIVNVDDKGFAVLVNKSVMHPIVLNGKALLSEKVLVNNDIFEVCGRKFQYVNSRMTEEKAKLYRNKTTFFTKRTPLKSRATMLVTPISNIVPSKQPVTPKSSVTNSVQLRNKQSLSVSASKSAKNKNLRDIKSATKPKTIYSPVQTRRSLFNNARNTSKLPIPSKGNISQKKSEESPKSLDEGLNCDLIDFNSPATNSASPTNVLDITKGSSRKRRINNIRNTPDSVTTPDGQNNGESSESEFLKNESLCRSTKKAPIVNSMRRFVTIRRARGKQKNFSFDSSSAGDETPSKANTSEVPVSPLTPKTKKLLTNSSKRKSTRVSLRVAKVRSKSLSNVMQSNSAKKRRCSVHATTAVSNKTLNAAENLEEEEQDMTTPVMTQNLSRKSLSAPRIHHMRISRLDDDINESLHMDDSVSETPVIHETSRRSLAKRSTVRLQESLRLMSPSTEEPSLFENTNANGTPDSYRKSKRFSEKDTFKTPLKTEEFSNLLKSDGKLSNMKVSITSTPKEQTPTRGVKRQLQASLDEGNFKRTKIFTRSSSVVETEELSKKETSSFYEFCGTPTRIINSTSEPNISRKSRSRWRLDQENLISNESSLLESTAVSSIVYETSVSKIGRRTPMSEKKELQKLPSSAENVKLKTPDDNLNNISGIETFYASPVPSTSKSLDKGTVELTNSVTRKISDQQKSAETQKSPKNDLTNILSLRRLMKTPKEQKSPKNDLREIFGVKKLMQTPKEQKSPKNDLTNVQSLRRLMQTPKEKKSRKNVGVKKIIQKSPRNDLTNIPNLRRLMQTPREQKSPENDLTNIPNLRRLMRTPKEQKSPKNDLTEIIGVKKLMQTPKEQKSPKNDLTNIRSLRRLMQTPKEKKSRKHVGMKKIIQKSPRNDLTNIPNLRRLMQTPKEQKSPKNDLTEIVGVKKLMQTPKKQKSPKNDLTNIRSLRCLTQTPKEQKSPKNDLTNIPNLRRLIQTPKQQKSPNNDLTDIVGVRKLMQTPKEQKSPKNDLTQVSGVKKLLQTPKQEKSPKNDLTRLYSLRLLQTPKNQKSPKNDLTGVSGVKALLRTPRAQKEPKNDLGNVSGVKELFEREEEFSAAADAFDKLVQKKRPIITYRGKSFSPAKSTKNLPSSRYSTEITDRNVKPEVEKWVLEQRNLKYAMTTLKRKTTEDLEGDEVPKKRVTRQARGPVVTSVRSTRQQKGNGDGDSAIKTRSHRGKKDDSKEISYQNEESVLSIDVTPIQAPHTRTHIRTVTSSDESLADIAKKIQNQKKIRTRGQKKKSEILNEEFSDATPQKQKSIRSRKEKKVTVTQNEESILSVDMSAQEQKRTGTLRQKKRDRNQNRESVGDFDTSLKERKITRGRRHNTNEKPAGDEDTQYRTRTRSVSDTPPVETTKRTRARAQVVNEESISSVDTSAQEQKRTRTLRQKKRDLNQNRESVGNIDTSLKERKITRGRRHNTNEKAAGDEETQYRTKTRSVRDTPPVETTKTRARAQVVIEEPVETKRSTRRTKKTKTEEQSSTEEKENELKVTRNRVTRQKKVSPVKVEDKKTDKKVHFEGEKASTSRTRRQKKILNTEELNEVAEVEPLELRRSVRRK